MESNTRSPSAGEAADELKGAEATTAEPKTPEAAGEPSGAAAEAPKQAISKPRPGVPDKARELQPIVPAERKKDHRIFARMSASGVVAEIINEVQNIEEEWHPDALKLFVEITDEKEKPEPGWTRDGKKFKKPEPIVFTAAQKRQVAMEIDGAVVGKSKVKLTGELWQRLGQIAQHAAVFKELPGGDLTIPGDPPLTFKKADDFLATYKALSVWRERWNQHVDGNLGAAPSNRVV